MLVSTKPLLACFLLLSFSFATNVSGVREAPERIVHSRASTSVASPKDGSAQAHSPLLSMGVVPETKMKSKTDYIKEFLAFSSFNGVKALAAEDNAPLKTRFTNLERILSDDTDLRTWTRFIVENDRDEEFHPVETHPSASVIDLKIDEFIEFLVTHRGFVAEDLQFLHDTDADNDYDTIDEELTMIKASYTPSAYVESAFRSEASLNCLGMMWVLPFMFLL